MRRLWAHILIAFAALVAVFASMPSLIRGVSTNGDHVRGREFTFQLTERDEVDGEKAPAKLSADSAKRMASIMESRLLASGVDSYKISTSGDKEVDDIITVSFSADNDTQYTQIVTYLGFSGSFALMNNQNDVVTDKEFRNGSAFLKNVNVNEFPTVILPIKTDYEAWTVLVTNALSNLITEEAQSEEEEAKSHARIWLIYNYEEGDTYESLSKKKKLDSKTLYYFDFETEDELYYDTNKNSLARVCGYADANGNGVADANEVRTAFNTADYYLNLFNADALDYEVECIRGLGEYKVWVEPSSEYIIKSDKINWNPTLTATLAAIVVISLLLVVFYRLGAISVVTSTLVTVALSVFFMVQTALTYNVLALAGFVVVAIASLVSGIIYLNKLKEDAYKGHTLKKANIEASKKSLLPIVDINAVVVVTGLMVYLLGGTAFHAFGSIVLFGGLVSLLLNTLGLKGMMWLATNATGLAGKYQLFGINPENVPNHMEEEKQRYFGPYADKDVTKRKKSVGFIALGAFVLSLAGAIVCVSLNGGQLAKASQPTVSNVSQIYVVNKIDEDNKDKKLDENKLQSQFLSVIEIKQEDGTYKTLDNYTSSSTFVNYEVTSSETVEEVTTNYISVYYVLTLDKSINYDSIARISSLSSEDMTLGAALRLYSEDSTYKNTASIKVKTTYVNAPASDLGKITLAVSISALILTVYFVLRYRLSRGLASLVFPVVGVTITLGLLALINAVEIVIPATVNAALPFVLVMSYAFMILIMNKDREMVLEDKVRDNSYEHREELSKKALGMALTPVLASAVIGIYLLINFFGFGTAIASYIYLLAILGSLVSLGIIAVLYTPVANFLYKLFSKVNLNIKPRESKKKSKVVKKSAEPEEAIFIGIND